MSKKILLWDADALAYTGKSDETIADILYKIDCKIHDIVQFSNADGYILFLSEGKYFRHDITKPKDGSRSTYKNKRVYGGQPYVKVIKEYLKAQYGAVSYKGLEADDMVVYFNNNQELSELGHKVTSDSKDPSGFADVIIVATDKDVLNNTVGKHINPSKKNPITKEFERIWIETNKEDANKHFWTQVIAGDTTDNIKGIPGKGERAAKNLFDKYRPKASYPVIALHAYIDHFGEAEGIDEFQKTYRLIKMLETDDDMMREVGYIPAMPKVQLVEKLVDVNTDLI